MQGSTWKVKRQFLMPSQLSSSWSTLWWLACSVMSPHLQSSSRTKVITVMYETMYFAVSSSTLDAFKAEAGEVVDLTMNQATTIRDVERHHHRYVVLKTTMSSFSVEHKTCQMQALMPALLSDHTTSHLIRWHLLTKCHTSRTPISLWLD